MKREIKEWLENRKMECVSRLSEIMQTENDIQVGDKVMFTNEAGCIFGPYEVFAISKDNELWKYGHCIFVENASYWFPNKPEEITVIGNNGKWIKVADCLPPIQVPIFCHMKFGDTQSIRRERMWDEQYREYMIKQGYLVEWLPMKGDE
jgi:hypothetical protein